MLNAFFIFSGLWYFALNPGTAFSFGSHPPGLTPSFRHSFGSHASISRSLDFSDLASSIIRNIPLISKIVVTNFEDIFSFVPIVFPVISKLLIDRIIDRHIRIRPIYFVFIVLIILFII